MEQIKLQRKCKRGLANIKTQHLPPKFAAKCLTVLPFMREITSSNLGTETG
jgi:hypothetical protein